MLRLDYGTLFDSQKVGMLAIRNSVQTVFEDFLSTGWVSKIESHLKICFLELSDRNADLGLPMPSLQVYKKPVENLLTLIPTVYPLFSPSMLSTVEETEFKELLTTTVKGLCRNCNWVDLQLCTCWDIIDKLSKYSVDIKKMIPLDQLITECDLINSNSRQALQYVVESLIVFTEGENPLSRRFMDNLLNRNLPESKAVATRKESGIFKQCLSFALSTIGIEQMPTVCKFDRFPLLVKSFEEYAAYKIFQSLETFKRKGEKYISTHAAEIIGIQYSQRKESIEGVLDWKVDSKVHANNIITMYMKEVIQILPTIVQEWTVPESCMKENCTSERIDILNQMTDIANALTGLNDLKIRVELVRFYAHIYLCKHIHIFSFSFFLLIIF